MIYVHQFKDEPTPGIPCWAAWPYQELSGLDPNKPIMIAEWATGEFPYPAGEPGIRKPEWIKQALELFRTRYPRVKAAVYWHEPWQNVDQTYSNFLVISSVKPLQASP